MDMAAHARICGDTHALLERIIGEREGGVQAHHGCDLTVTLANLLDEAPVLIYSSALHIPVGYLIAEGSAQAGLAHGGLQQIQGTLALPRRSMMVDHGGGAIADALDERDLRREQDILVAERHIELPPQAFEDLHEIRGGLSW